MRNLVLVVCACVAMSCLAEAGFSNAGVRDRSNLEKRILPKTKVVALDPGANCIDGPDVPLVIEVPFDFRIPEYLIWRGPIPKK